jgi:hypothetical protein
MFLVFFWLMVLTVSIGVGLHEIDNNIEKLKDEIEILKKNNEKNN